MNLPNELLYSKSHEWVRLEGTKATVGLTDYAQDQLGDIVFVNLPMEGDTVSARTSLGDVESVKAVSDVYCPVSGVVTASNSELLDAPEKINESPYEAWLIQVEMEGEREELLSAQEYQAFLATLEE